MNTGTEAMYQPWTEMEISKFVNRQNRLKKMGMNEMESEKLAERLLYRDRPDSGDDRKLCLECKNWRKRCVTPKPGYCTVPTMLQRCDGFKAVMLFLVASAGQGTQGEGVTA